METIQTERLTIRNFTRADSEALRTMILQYSASEYAAYDHAWPTSAAEIQKVTEWFASGDSYLAVCLRDSGHFIGFVDLNPEEGRDETVFNLGYIFNSDFHGQGYATEACQAALARASGELGAARVVTGTHEANLPSRRLLARLGLKPIDRSPGEYVLSRADWQKAH